MIGVIVRLTLIFDQRHLTWFDTRLNDIEISFQCYFETKRVNLHYLSYDLF